MGLNYPSFLKSELSNVILRKEYKYISERYLLKRCPVLKVINELTCKKGSVLENDREGERS